jgi:hypothetical protein
MQWLRKRHPIKKEATTKPKGLRKRSPMKKEPTLKHTFAQPKTKEDHQVTKGNPR